MKRKLFVLFSMFAIVAIAFTGCQKDNIDQKDAVATTSTSEAGIVPVTVGTGNGGNVECDSDTYAETSGRINYEDGEFSADFPAGFTVTTDGTSVTWSYTPVDGMCLDGVSVIVKGGPAANVYTYEAGINGDSGLVSPIVPGPRGGIAGLSNLTFCYNLVPCEEEECWQEETAYGGNTAGGGGSGWWYYFDVDGFETQDIYAGQEKVEDAFVNFVDGILTIELGPNMRLQDVEEAVKVQVYAEDQLPSSRPASGLLTTYKGNELVLELEGEFRYIVIHLDVEVKVECPE